LKAAPALVFLHAMLLAGCSVSPPRDTPPADLGASRQQHLSVIDKWSFRGRIAISDGEDGGSGTLDWVQDGHSFTLNFFGALGRGAWMLQAGPQYAVLETAKGERWEADDVSSLVEQHLGWRVPMDALPFWVRGLTAPGTVADTHLDESGLPLEMIQEDWRVSYQRWNDASHIVMPSRIDAYRGEYSFKLIVREWRFTEPAD
jgi:outer membrane lipoprotein LolB